MSRHASPGAAATAAAAAATAAALLAACASELPYDIARDGSGGTIAVRILGDGFVRTGERRIPLEAFVLELRQRVRPMAPADRARLTVQVEVVPDGGPTTAEAKDRLLGELQIMGVKDARFL